MFKFCSALVLVIACAACGSKFTSNEGSGFAGSGTGGDANGGDSSTTGGSGSGDAGDSSIGGTDTGGPGGSVNVGGSGASAGSGGSAADDPCAKLKEDFQIALEKARACTQGSTNECSPSSTIEPLGCGCPVLVNANSEYTTLAKKARQAYRDAKCMDNTVCPAIACVQPMIANCAPATSKNSFVCAAVNALPN